MENIFEKYPPKKAVKLKNGQTIPILDIPMMSDEDWQRIAREQAVEDYRKAFGIDPGSVEAACKWHREAFDIIIKSGGEIIPWNHQ